MDQLSRADEDRSRLEELVAHLEFEASNLGDFVVLVTHRRQAAKRRATRREAMLARLVEDRRCLQRRLTELVELIRRSHQLLLKKTGDQTLWDELQERRKCNEGINETIGGNETKEQGKQPDSIASREERETKGEEDLLSQSLGERFSVLKKRIVQYAFRHFT
ncbi:unnamed protein product [Protopolystoma xenopodis]|uniref:Uncharacterized protein n=1 Tax=Protopolystoma xenopodis TaxID=117903 RepID=A0A448WAJ0_9PLAT|nr:unnamed protein product [Protopolystoma xenopodis]